MDEVDEKLTLLADKEYFENKYNVKDKGVLLLQWEMEIIV